jgi:hypothetical protein
MWKITNLSIAILITSFLAGNAYGEVSSKRMLEDLEKLAKKEVQWSEEKVKDLGIPEVKEGTVIMCEGVEATGFDWVNGEYIKEKFRVKKELYKKVKPDQWCFGWKKLTADEKMGTINPKGQWNAPYDLTPYQYAFRKGCYSVYPFGEKPTLNSVLCTERYNKEGKQDWETTIECKRNIYFTALSPNGLFHRFQTHTNLSQTDKKKFSLVIEWGKCATISP